MKKIFIVKGGDDTGKTTKINLIIDWIFANYTISNSVIIPINQIDRYGIIQINKLTIGFNTAGDNETEVKKIDNLKGVLNNINDDNLLNDLDIIICACRTKGKGRQYIINNYNYSNNWLQKFINIEKFSKADVAKQNARDLRKIEELKTWLIGLEKI